MKVQFYVDARYNIGPEQCAAKAGEEVDLPGPVGSDLAARAVVRILEFDPPPLKDAPRSVVTPRSKEFAEYDDGTIRRAPGSAPGSAPAPSGAAGGLAPVTDLDEREAAQRPSDESPNARNDDDDTD